MSNLLITHAGDDDWSVWISLPDYDPVDDLYGFIIGSGETRDAAVAAAVADLEAAVERLQAPRYGVDERSLSASPAPEGP